MRFPRRAKFGNHKITIDGERFDSKLEARRWAELQLLERAGEIVGLKRQVKYLLSVNGVGVTAYVADFVYTLQGCDTAVVEDAKGVLTDVFRIKAKLFRALMGFPITIWPKREKKRRRKRSARA